jgi:hypothetical protein
MRDRPVAAPMRTSIASLVVLAGLTSLALLGRVESVSAKDNMGACAIKHSVCFEKCVSNNPGSSDDPETKRGRCVKGTCDHQYKACSGESGPPDYTNMDPPKGTRPITDRSPRGPRPGGGLSGGGSRPGGGVSVGGRPGRDAGNVRDHRGPRGRGPRPTQLTSQSPGSPADQVRVPRGPLGGGILDSLGLGGVRQQGPASTGSPMAPAAAPSAPPVIIR